MYLHLGQNVVVPSESVVAIFDMDNSTHSSITRNFLSKAEKFGSLITITDDIPKSFVLCSANNKSTIYLSQLSSQTLSKRFDSPFY